MFYFLIAYADVLTALFIDEYVFVTLKCDTKHVRCDMGTWVLLGTSDTKLYNFFSLPKIGINPTYFFPFELFLILKKKYILLEIRKDVFSYRLQYY